MFKYYNANPYGRIVNDCTVRAISLATNMPWDETYVMLSERARKRGITFSEVEFIDNYLDETCDKYDIGTVITLQDFLEKSIKGRWLITMRGHITCVIDGICYDTFDPSNRFVWGIYRVKGVD